MCVFYGNVTKREWVFIGRCDSTESTVFRPSLAISRINVPRPFMSTSSVGCVLRVTYLTRICIHVHTHMGYPPSLRSADLLKMSFSFLHFGGPRDSPLLLDLIPP